MNENFYKIFLLLFYSRVIQSSFFEIIAVEHSVIILAKNRYQFLSTFFHLTLDNCKQVCNSSKKYHWFLTYKDVSILACEKLQMVDLKFTSCTRKPMIYLANISTHCANYNSLKFQRQKPTTQLHTYVFVCLLQV